MFFWGGKDRFLPRTVPNLYSQSRWQLGLKGITQMSEGRVEPCARREGFKCLVSVSPPALCYLFSFSLDAHTVRAPAMLQPVCY